MPQASDSERSGAKAAELVAEVRGAEEALHALAEAVGLGDAATSLALFDGDFRGGKSFASRALLTMLGESKPDALGDTAHFLERIHPADRDSLTALLEGEHAQPSDNKAASPARFSTDLRVRAADGAWRWLRCVGCVLPSAPDKGAPARPQRILMFCEDHTEAHESREELTYARDFGEKVVRSTINGILGFDTELNIIEFNPALEQMFGVTRAMAVGRKVFEVLPFLRESHEDCFYYDTLAGKKQASFDRPYWRIDTGETGFFRANYIPLRERGREVTGGLVVVAETTFDRHNQRLQNILLEAGTKLAQSHEPNVVLDVLLQLAVPGLCDWSVVYLREDDTFFVRHSDPALQERLEKLLVAPNAALRTFLCTLPISGDDTHVATETVEEVPHSLFRLLGHNEKLGPIFKAVGLASYFRVALTSQGHTLGTMTFVASSEKISERTRAVSELVALRGALAVANALLVARSRAAEDALLRIEREVLAPLRAGAALPNAATESSIAKRLGHLLARARA